MSRLPIRARLTAAFALALIVVLAAVAAFVYAQVRSDLDESIDNSLRSRIGDFAASVGGRGPDWIGVGVESDEAFSQLLSREGHLLIGVGGSGRPVKPIPRPGTFTERDVAGIEGTARMFARHVTTRSGPAVAVVGTSLEDRDETLAGLVRAFLFGGGGAVLLASAIGWLLASAGMRPIEAMRRRAEKVSLARGEERLPLPAARDEVHRLGETLNEMLARLQESFERERRFVADASHELRTPLAVLKTELEAALRRPGLDPEVRTSLAAAVEEADQLAQLAEDLLLLARSADGRLPVRTERVGVDELLERSAERFADRAREGGRAISTRVPPGLSAELDPLRARQALGNLIDNALRHGAGNIHLVARPENRTLHIEVSDEGNGFPANLAPRAFERFARGDAARSRGGAGLGLAIVAAIAEAHGGTASIAANGGGRTTVRLTLPLRRAA